MTATRKALLAAGCLVMASLPVRAHHSVAMFEEKKTITVEGVVKEFQYTIHTLGCSSTLQTRAAR